MKNEVLHTEVLNGTITADTIVIDCYHLSNDKRVVSISGICSALGIKENATRNTRLSGDILQNMILINKYKDFDRAKADYISKQFDDSFIRFTTKRSPSPTFSARGYEATFLIELCHYIQDLYHAKVLKEEHWYLFANANIIERAFAKLGIIAYIDEATGYKKKKENEYRILFQEYIRQEASKWEKEFPDELFDVFYSLYPNAKQKKKDKQLTKDKHFSFFAGLIRKYIYKPLASSNGMILQELETKNPYIIVYKKSTDGKIVTTRYRKDKFFQWLEDEIDKPALKRHIYKLIGIGEASMGDKVKFERDFMRVFKPDSLPMFPELENQWSDTN